MTLNLQTVLAIIGIVVVLLIYLISRWQNRRSLPKFSRSKSHSEKRDFANADPEPGDFNQPEEIPAHAQHHDSTGDSLIDDAPDDAPDVISEVSPEFASEPIPAADDSTSPPPEQPDKPMQDARTPVFNSAPVLENNSDEFRSRRIEGFERLSQIDYWVKITGERDVGRETVLALYRDAAANFSKAHSIHGFKMPDQAWCNVVSEAEDSRFTDLVMTIQLADHNGAISEREMRRFSALVSRLSEGTGREFVFMTPVANAFAQADAIAEFVRHFDSVFAVNLHPQDSECFHGSVIDRYALQMGLEQNDNQYYSRFKFVSKSKVALYSLAALNDTGCFDFDDIKSCNPAGLTFFTKPAVNGSPGAVFAEMVDTARVLASRMKGKVTLSDDDKDLTQDTIDTTRKSIERVVAEMERAGIAAGSTEATRIF